MSVESSAIAIWRTLFLAQWRVQPARLIVMLLVIAVGVALGTSVYLVNETAVNEFTLATKRLVGEADLIIRGSERGFAESLYPRLADEAEVDIASPMLEVEAAIPGQRSPLKILGLDPLRAAQIQPQLIADIGAQMRDLFALDTIFLSAAAASELALKPGQYLTVLVGHAPRRLRVLGILSPGSYSQALGLMDIACAQSAFDRIGRVNRIDLRLRAGTDVETFRRKTAAQLPAGVLAIAPTIERDRAVSVTRAYRINLNMLALVSLLTSAFLVFSIQSLAMLRRRSSIALLRALGVTRAQMQGGLLAEGAAIGALGSLLGVIIGWMIATALVRLLSGDLGGQQLRVMSRSALFDAWALGAAFLIGTAFACAGAWIPAREAARRDPARALKSGDAELAVRTRAGVPAGAALIGLGVLLAFLPPSHGIPIAGYAAIAALLFGAILWVPRFTQTILGRVPRTRAVSADLALAQLNASHGLLFLSLAPIIVSFALMVAMAIMVHSFRSSFEVWLAKLLPADLQMRLPAGSQTAAWSAADQQWIGALSGVARADFRRSQLLYLRADREPVTLIARELNERNAARVLPLVGTAASGVAGDGIWVSEAAQDKYGWAAGERIRIPLGGAAREFTVAGVWRDYARTNGALVIARSAYIRATGDASANEASLWLAAGPGVEKAVRAAIQARFAGLGAMELTASSELQRKSLRIFDHAFAVTYALEALAVVIGLAGVSVAASFTALTRRAEFGMLRHVGMLRSQVLTMLAAEGTTTALLGALYGLALGFALSLVLVFVVNRQSFNWSIDLSVPAAQLLLFAVTLVCAAALTAIAGGRSALAEDALRAVREDW